MVGILQFQSYTNKDLCNIARQGLSRYHEQCLIGLEFQADPKDEETWDSIQQFKGRRLD